MAGRNGWRLVMLGALFDHVHLFVQAHPRDSPSHIAKL